MLAQERQARILKRVREQGAARVSELVREHGVSDMTIRRDLEVLAQRGLLVKVHGGATAAELRSTEEPGFATKRALNQTEKEAIARRAAELVQPGSAIGLSAGTTVHSLAHFLLDLPGLTVVTNSVPVADVFYSGGRGDQEVILTGGARTPSDALVGPVASQTLARLNLDQVIMGVHGMSERSGFTTPNPLEAEVNRAFLRSSNRLTVLADHTKWETVGLCKIAPLSRASIVVTDPGLGLAARAALDAEVGELLVAEPGLAEDSAS
jgi:DeoR/GlpR family transcriptional regulator of sugar metabolism